MKTISEKIRQEKSNISTITILKTINDLGTMQYGLTKDQTLFLAELKQEIDNRTVGLK